jgi:hypothetical protein
MQTGEINKDTHELAVLANDKRLTTAASRKNAIKTSSRLMKLKRKKKIKSNAVGKSN